MTHKQKIKYMEIAASLAHLHLEPKNMDLMVSLYDLVTKKEGNADMMDVAKVQSRCESREIERKKSLKPNT